MVIQGTGLTGIGATTELIKLAAAVILHKQALLGLNPATLQRIAQQGFRQSWDPRTLSTFTRLAKRISPEHWKKLLEMRGSVAFGESPRQLKSLFSQYGIRPIQRIT